ncbi:thioredoxin domain-containing protein [Streptomyces luomodiensis]|uniref:Thioredoxin domain-containing protein n=1 Tax=Streptomyces luomodiensis TaxID=3026192 RepID=A0ABY9UTZ1_9ACTN|nr:thioredoxin domain-containing protein [Streptomyces sp. SCA4-21]WNE96019.1 thioredoxin domain-containing protein [Streptomyces sp. SCA4-21]
MWPGEQPPGGEQNPQRNPYQQPGYQQPGHPPPPAQPPGFPPAPPPPPGPVGAPGPADRQRRSGLTAVVAVTVAAAALAGVLVITDDDTGSKDSAADVVQGGSDGSTDADGSGGSQKLVTPAHSSGPSGTTVVIGEAGSGHTLDVYEDLRCPPCAAFEQGVGPTIAKDIKDGTYQVSFHFAAILDETMGGSGSANALSALGAALDVSTDAFLDYKAALMSSKNHPVESKDSYADDDYLLNVSQEVSALKTNASFRAAVREGTYDPWAKQMIADFDASGVNGTPTVELDGSPLQPNGSTPVTATEFTKAVNKQLKDG